MNNQQSFLKQRHSKFSTPQEEIFNLVIKATGEKPIKRTKVVKGYDNEVYFVDTKKGNTYVVKIRWFGSVTYKEEAWVLKQCKKANVPVPKILLLDEVELKDGKHETMVQEKIKGSPLAQIKKSLTNSQLEKVLIKAGKVLSRIHRIKVEGFYRRNKKGEWRYSTWQQFANSMVRARSQEKPYLLQAGITKKEFALLIKALEEYRNNFDCKQPVLCHGDFLPEHIFVDDKLNITGIIDFGMYEGNHPVHDFAFISFQAPSLNLEEIKKGYSNKVIFDEKFKRRLLLHKIALQMGYLAHHIKENMTYKAKFVYQTLRESLREL